MLLGNMEFKIGVEEQSNLPNVWSPVGGTERGEQIKLYLASPLPQLCQVSTQVKSTQCP